MNIEKELVYAAKFREKHGNVGVYKMPYDAYVINEENTNRHPDIFQSWIKYWIGFSEYNESVVLCSVTGEELFVDEAYKPLNEFLRLALNESKKGYAEGAHVRVEGIEGIPDGVYITPMKHEKNMKIGKDVLLRKGSILVAEVAPIDND